MNNIKMLNIPIGSNEIKKLQQLVDYEKGSYKRLDFTAFLNNLIN